MSDDLDATDLRQQQMLDATIQNIRIDARVDINGSGACLVCGNEVEPVICGGKLIVGRWCSLECRSRNDIN